MGVSRLQPGADDILDGHFVPSALLKGGHRMQHRCRLVVNLFLSVIEFILCRRKIFFAPLPLLILCLRRFYILRADLAGIGQAASLCAVNHFTSPCHSKLLCREK
jgi:hypothetical protein